ncbi:MAG: ComEC/Rec2 family competence protein [bacterium]|nr:ComEC/Rec2 family competence protein [bacterium]
MAGAAAIWIGALLGAAAPTAVAVAATLAGLLVAMMKPQLLLIVVFGVGMFAGSAANGRVAETLGAELPTGPGTVVGTARTDATGFGERYRFVVAPETWGKDGRVVGWQGPPLAVVTHNGAVVAGDRVRVTGLLRDLPDLVRGDAVAGQLVATELDVVGGAGDPVMRAGNLVRARVHTQLEVLGASPEAALLAGFLIGDITSLPTSDSDNLRRSGLTHYVAVSGSNVALVLAALWLVLGPASSRVRAIAGLGVLAVFVVATRWESSVIRAATMAALVLGARAFAVPVDAWTALGGAITILIATSGDLAYDVGFQLSVAATGGVLAGFRLFGERKPRVVWGALAATISAQLAVVPLLLVHFGAVPLLSPIANLLAAPLVTVATALAGLGVITGVDVPLRLAEQCAGLFLGIADRAALWPQLGAPAVVAIGGVLVAVWRTPLRGIVIATGVVLGLLAAVPPGPPEEPTVVFLDVGQGDAVLLLDPSGAVALVDGGREPTILAAGLRRYGIGRLDLVVATHGDADHVAGLVGLAGEMEIDHLWISDFMDPGELLGEIMDESAATGTIISAVSSGRTARLGEFDIEVLGPVRRYSEDNDGSVVLWVSVGNRTVLLPGDIGKVPQRDLPGLQPDLMMVPHHGSATTDLDWLAATVGDTAVISVGANTYGHPDSAVMSTLESVGVVPMLTQERGDIVLPLR